ncbi:MAG: cyclodehydratase, partial [Ilumatobacteraceae bacterium]|nr:cyclodehydratase [Ilumatobacteraceae bacterium]
MKRRSLRSILLATAAAASGLVVATTMSSPASAATASQGLDCGVGGSQTAVVTPAAPATVETGGTFQVTLGPGPTPSKADGAEIKNLVTTFNVPSGASIVAGSASATGGSGLNSTPTVAISGTTVKLTVPGPIASGATFVNPTLKFNLTATGGAGGTIKTTFKQAGAYTLTAAGSFNVTCNATTPLTTLTSTTIQAAATTTTTAAPTTTTTTGATTTTTGGATTTTTTAAPTTTTTAGPTTTTTTAPPTITTQTWSPGTACGVAQSTTAPANTISVSITAVGGKGGKSGSQASSAKRDGGSGGQAFGTFAASPGQTYTGVVGCNGADGQNGAATSTSAAGYAYGGNTGNGSIVIGQTGAGGGGGGAASGACLGAD